MSTAQRQTVTSERVAARECTTNSESDLVTWAQDALGRMMLPEDGSDRVALTMEIEVQEEPSKPLQAAGPPQQPEFFLSPIDRDYIKLLVMLGYREEAAGLVEQAHRAKFSERRGHQRPEIDDDPRLFSIYDLEYLELLLIVGRREKAVELVLRLMDEYEINVLSKIVRVYEEQSRLEMEYRSIIAAIDTEGFVPRERAQRPSEQATSFLGRLFAVLAAKRR